MSLGVSVGFGLVGLLGGLGLVCECVCLFFVFFKMIFVGERVVCSQ